MKKGETMRAQLPSPRIIEEPEKDTLNAIVCEDPNSSTNSATSRMPAKEIKSIDSTLFYSIQHRVSRESANDVYEAKMISSGKHETSVIVKMLREHQSKNPAKIGELDREAKILAFYRSFPNIVQFHDAGMFQVYGKDFVKIGERYCLMMNKLSGIELLKFLNCYQFFTKSDSTRHPRFMPNEIAASILLDISKALAHFHNKPMTLGSGKEKITAGIVHRDIKPANIYVTDYGRGVLIDFGIAAQTGLEGKVHGTPYYMSPEALAGETLNSSSDVYSLCSSACEMLCGKIPNYVKGTGNWQEIAEKILQYRQEGREPKKLDEIVSDVDTKLAGIIFKGISLDKNQRITADELVKELRGWLADKRVSDHNDVIGAYMSLKINGAARDKYLLEGIGCNALLRYTDHAREIIKMRVNPFWY